jgi:hypothetical protein
MGPSDGTCLSLCVGRLLTMPELRKFSEIDRLEEQIAALVFESKTFFETDEELEARVKVTHSHSHTLALDCLPCPHASVLCFCVCIGCEEEGGGWGGRPQEEGSHRHHHSSTQHRMVRPHTNTSLPQH